MSAPVDELGMLRARKAAATASTTWPRPWNQCAIIIGLPGDGKSTLVRKLIMRHVRETPGIVLAHDPLAQFTKMGCVFFPNVAAYRRAANLDGKNKTPMPRAVSIGGEESAEDVTRLALELGERAGNREEAVRLPILVPFDEGTMRDDSGSTWMGKLDKKFIVTRRHRGVAPIFNIQDVTLLMQQFYRLSTDVYVFQMPSDRANALDLKLHLEKGTLVRAGVTRLRFDEHEYLHVRPRIGIVEAPL